MSHLGPSLAEIKQRELESYREGYRAAIRDAAQIPRKFLSPNGPVQENDVAPVAGMLRNISNDIKELLKIRNM